MQFKRKDGLKVKKLIVQDSLKVEATPEKTPATVFKDMRSAMYYKIQITN